MQDLLSNPGLPALALQGDPETRGAPWVLISVGVLLVLLLGAFILRRLR